MPVAEIRTAVVTKVQRHECYESSTTVQTKEICTVIPAAGHNTVVDSETVGGTPVCNAVPPAPMARSPLLRGNPIGKK